MLQGYHSATNCTRDMRNIRDFVKEKLCRAPLPKMFYRIERDLSRYTLNLMEVRSSMMSAPDSWHRLRPDQSASLYAPTKPREEFMVKQTSNNPGWKYLCGQLAPVACSGHSSKCYEKQVIKHCGVTINHSSGTAGQAASLANLGQPLILAGLCELVE